MKLKFVLLLVMSVLMGCASIFGDYASGPCAGPSEYVDRTGKPAHMEDPSTTALCKVDPAWTETKLGLLVVNDIALRKELYTPEQALAGIDKIQALMDAPSSTVAGVASGALTLIGKYPELFIATTALEEYTVRGDIVIDDFTHYHFGKMLNQQRSLILLFKE